MGSRFVSTQTNSADAIALVGAVAAIALTVLALVGIAPRTLTCIAAICTGAALLGHGALITRRIFALRSPVGATFEHAKVGETASDEVLGGACAIALGVLALIGVEPLLLLGIAAIAIGGALALAGPSREKFPHLGAPQEKYATLRPTRTGPKHRARRRKNRKTQARAKTRTLSRIRIKKVEANSTAKKPRKKSPRQAAAPKSLTELLAELPPPPSERAKSAEAASAEAASADVEPLFEPELLAPAHANAEFADTTVIGRSTEDVEGSRPAKVNARASRVIATAGVKGRGGSVDAVLHDDVEDNDIETRTAALRDEDAGDEDLELRGEPVGAAREGDGDEEVESRGESIGAMAATDDADDVAPLFEPELLAPAHTKAEFANPATISRASDGDANDTATAPAAAPVSADADAVRDADIALAVATQAEAPEAIEVKPAEAIEVKRPEHAEEPAVAPADEAIASAPELATAHDAEAEPTYVTDQRVVPPRTPLHQPARRGGLLSAVASALGKAKDLKHKIDAQLEAHPIEKRAPREETPREEPPREEPPREEPHALVTLEEPHALVKVEELAGGTTALHATSSHLVADHIGGAAPAEHEDAARLHMATSEPIDTHVGANERPSIDRELQARAAADAAKNERDIERDLAARAAANAVKTAIAHEQHSDTAHLIVHEPSHVLMADGTPYQPEHPDEPEHADEPAHADEPEHEDEVVAKGHEHERHALADAEHLVEKLGEMPDHASTANKKLEAEKVRESEDPTIDRHDGAVGVDAAYRREATAKALELQHELEHQLVSEQLEHEEREEHHEHIDDSDEKRANIAEVEPVPTTNEELHRERALFIGGAVWVVGGLASVVLGILALSGVARSFVLVEVAFLVAAASVLVSSLANGARVLARHDLVDEHEEPERDLDDALAQPPALHGRASNGSVSLHR